MTQFRTLPHEDEHRRSVAKKGDRIVGKPRRLSQLHRWLTDGYALEAPARLHDRDVADDGAPDHTGEAKNYLGLNYPVGQRADDEKGTEPTDWRRVACRTDRDGSYVTPMRCAIARIGDPDRRALLGGLACNIFTPLDVTRSMGIPDWCAGDVMYRALDLLWSVYADQPMPQRSGKSDAQLDAEAAA